MFQQRLAILLCMLCFVQIAHASSDTITIDEVQVNAQKTVRLRHEILPIQTLNPISLERLSSLQVSDAVKTFAGVQVKDYGGIGGLKTVSVRSLGAKYTVVSYDGVMLSDEQNGQVDIGKLSLENVQMISLANGQVADIFAPAKTFASGSVLSIETAQPAFSDSTHANITAGVKVGSFGFWAPTITYSQVICKRLAFLLNGEYQTANGDYPYTLTNGSVKEKLTRTNSDIQSIRAEANIFANISNDQNLSAKLYFYNSERGLPGSTIFYNPYSSQRLWNDIFFAQLKHKVKWSEYLSQKSFIKYSYDYTRYLDPDYLNMAGKLDSRYTQNEAYASTAMLFQALEQLQFSASIDAAYNSLSANLDSFACPVRYSILGNIAAKYEHRYFDISANVLGSAYLNEVEYGNKPEDVKKMSYAATAAVKPLANELLQLRFFYKDIFRMPSFNDLYYGKVGNTNLRPEQAKQYNAGISYYQSWQHGAHYVSLSADGYRNYVTDKIVAIPTKDLFVWSMMNMGKVEITGLDATAKVGFTPVSHYTISINGSYTYQKSIDKTSSQSNTYKHQIPYTPLHSGNAGVSLETPFVNLDYNVMLGGSRYALTQNTPDNKLSGYTDHSIAARRNFSLRRISLKASVEVLNLLNTQYEVIRYFPMPGRSVRATLSVSI